MAAQDMLMQSEKVAGRVGVLAALVGIVFVVPLMLAWLTLQALDGLLGNGFGVTLPWGGQLVGVWLVVCLGLVVVTLWGLWLVAVTYLGRALSVAFRGETPCLRYGCRLQNVANRWVCTALMGCPDASCRAAFGGASRNGQGAHRLPVQVLPPPQPEPPAVEFWGETGAAAPVWSTGDVAAHDLFVTSCPPGLAAEEATRLAEGLALDGLPGGGDADHMAAEWLRGRGA